MGEHEAHDSHPSAQRVVFAGVDEAGLGPLLGPLCIGAAAVSVPADIANEVGLAANVPGHLDLWSVLKAGITRDPKTTDRRTVICDSKLLHTPKSLRPIEESVLAFAAAAATALPATFAEFLATFSLTAMHRFEDYPWYKAPRLDAQLPVEATAEKCRQRSVNIEKCFAALDIRLEGLRVRPVLVGDFNDLLDETGNKSDAHFAMVVGMVGKLWERFPHVRVMVDKAGARDFYTKALRAAFPDATIATRAEAVRIPNSKPIPPENQRYPVYSSYTVSVDYGARTMQIDFVQDGENESLLIALASLFAKYTRENCMAAENAYWRELVANLKPTKGYVQDGRRFIADLEAAGHDLRTLRRLLVRAK